MDEEWRRGGMEGWAGREGKGKFIKALHGQRFIFTTKYTKKTYGGRASPDPLGELKSYPDTLAVKVDQG